MANKDYTIVGVLNVTPNSYFDGGKFLSPENALERASELLAQGADIIEVGGESTGPGSNDVSIEEERERVMPVIRSIRDAYPHANISVDTWKSGIAAEAIAAGAMMINDVTAGRSDPGIFSVVAQSSALLCLMHAKDATPRTTVEPTQYDDLIRVIRSFFQERIDCANAAGIPTSRLLLDPGLGHFVSSDPQYSFQILRQLERFSDLGCPLLVSPSRKSFLAGSEDLKTVDRLPGTIAASVIAYLNGASYIRTHDVLEVRRALEIAANIGR